MSGQRRRPVLIQEADRVTSALVPALAGLVALIALVCLVRLNQRRAVPLTALALVPLLFLATFAALHAMALRAASRGCDRRSRVLPVLLLSVVLLLTMIGFLTRLSLGARDAGAWPQPLVAVLGLLGLFGAIELAHVYRPSRDVRFVAGATAVAVILAQLSASPGRTGARRMATVPPGWPTPLLVICMLGLLAAALASPVSWLVVPRLEDVPPVFAGRRALLRNTLPAVTAVGLCALTGAPSMAIAFFAGGAGVLTAANRLTGHPGDRQAARAAHSRAGSRTVAGPAMTGSVILAVGACLITAVRAAFGDGHFTAAALAGAGKPYSAPFLPGLPTVFGPGFSYRNVGPASPGNAVLIVIARETGAGGLLGVGLLFLGLIGGLFWLTRPDRTRPVGSSWARGLAWLICAQVMLPALTVLLAMVHGPSVGTGPPLLAGGAYWYVAILTAIGVIIGNAWRPGPGQAIPAANTVPATLHDSQIRD